MTDIILILLLIMTTKTKKLSISIIIENKTESRHFNNLSLQLHLLCNSFKMNDDLNKNLSEIQTINSQEINVDSSAYPHQNSSQVKESNNLSVLRDFLDTIRCTDNIIQQRPNLRK